MESVFIAIVIVTVLFFSLNRMVFIEEDTMG